MSLSKSTYHSSKTIGNFLFSSEKTITKKACYDFLYEKENHLGNVHVVISDRKLPVDDGVYDSNGNQTSTTPDGIFDYYEPDVVFAADYYAGVGMVMPGRLFVTQDHRYGAQGSEVDQEIDGSRDRITTYYRQGNLKTMRWDSPDPKTNASWSPYAMMQGNPVLYNDVLGDSIRVPNNIFDASKAGTEGYNNEGLNMQDWNTFSSGIQEVSGITLATPSIADKNLTIQSVDESIGSEGARKEYTTLLGHKKLHQNVEISNNNPDVLGAHNATAFQFDKDGNFVGTNYNAGTMYIDLADFRQWNATNSGIKGTTDSRALGIGFSFLHENLHNRGFGMFGLTEKNLKTFDLETPVINQINVMRQQMGLPNRQGHSRGMDKVGGYLNFDDGTKYYIK